MRSTSLFLDQLVIFLVEFELRFENWVPKVMIWSRFTNVGVITDTNYVYDILSWQTGVAVSQCVGPKVKLIEFQS